MGMNVGSQAVENAEIKDDALHPCRLPPSSGRIGEAMFVPIRGWGQDRTNTCPASERCLTASNHRPARDSACGPFGAPPSTIAPGLLRLGPPQPIRGVTRLWLSISP